MPVISLQWRQEMCSLFFFIILHWKLIWLWNVCDQTTHISSTQHVSITRVAWWRMVASQQKSTGFFPKVQRQLVRVWARMVVCCLSVLALRQTGKLSRMYPGCNPLLTGYIIVVLIKSKHKWQTAWRVIIGMIMNWIDRIYLNAIITVIKTKITQCSRDAFFSQ